MVNIITKRDLVDIGLELALNYAEAREDFNLGNGCEESSADLLSNMNKSRLALIRFLNDNISEPIQDQTIIKCVDSTVETIGFIQK